MALHSTSEISLDWLTSVLGSPAGSLRSFSVSRIGEGAGILGEISRVTLEWVSPRDAPASVVVKLALDDPVMRARPTYAQVVEREIRFYRELAAESPVRTPRVYVSEYNRETGDATLVMEDLGRGTIYETGTAPREAVLAAARSVVSLHAHWWDDTRLASYTWLAGTTPNAAALKAMRAALPIVTPWYEQHFPDLLPLAKGWLESAERGLAPVPVSPSTLIHGDLGLKNVAFVDGKPVIFDWQLAACSPAAYELAEMVKDCFREDGPRPLMEALLPAYHDALGAAGVSSLPYEHLREDFGVSLMRRLTAPLVQLSVPNPSPGRYRNTGRWMEVVRAFAEEFEFKRRIDKALAAA